MRKGLKDALLYVVRSSNIFYTTPLLLDFASNFNYNISIKGRSLCMQVCSSRVLADNITSLSLVGSGVFLVIYGWVLGIDCLKDTRDDGLSYNRLFDYCTSIYCFCPYQVVITWGSCSPSGSTFPSPQIPFLY